VFQRVIYQDWQLVFPIVAFAAAAAVFAIVVVRAIRMKRAELDRFARMPLEEESPATARHE
jgi:hypothetical protein